MNTNLSRVIELLDELSGCLELVSFGLAPNPNGFCYEVLDESIDRERERELSYLLGSLDKESEQYLIEVYL